MLVRKMIENLPYTKCFLKHNFPPHLVRAHSKHYTKNKEFCILYVVKQNYISPSSSVGIQLHVSALYVGHLQVVI